MATSSREQPRNWVWWLVGGLVVALVVIGAYMFAMRAQRADLPRPADLSVQMPTPSSLPDAPNLPPAPVPAPR
jgi:hypothetical protein